MFISTLTRPAARVALEPARYSPKYLQTSPFSTSGASFRFGSQPGKIATEVHSVNLLSQGLRGWQAYRQAVQLTSTHLHSKDKQLNKLKQRGRLQALFQPSRAALLVGERQHQQVTGTSLLLPAKAALKTAASTIAMLYSVVVAPEARGTGLGKHLVTQALEEANKRQYDYLVLTSKPGAAGFYKKLGFQPLTADTSLPKPLRHLAKLTKSHPLYQGKTLFWRKTESGDATPQLTQLNVAA